MNSANYDIYIMIISVTVVLLILLVFIVSFLFIYRSRQMKNRVEMETVKEKYNQEILKSQLEIKEQTMKYISEEIHDNVGQILSLVVLNLSGIDLHDPVKAAAKIETTTNLVEKAVADLRNLSKTLDAENIASLGLTAIIRFELDLLEKTGAYRTALKINGDEKRLEGAKELVLYRIIQEALNNIIKHAKASVINIQVDYSDTQIEIRLLDNGTGFDMVGKEKESIYLNGAGLKNMEKRTRLIGGIFNIKSVASSGTTVSITIPFIPA